MVFQTSRRGHKTSPACPCTSFFVGKYTASQTESRRFTTETPRRGPGSVFHMAPCCGSIVNRAASQECRPPGWTPGRLKGLTAVRFGVLDKAVPIEHSHGHPSDGQFLAPQIQKGDGPESADSALCHQHVARSTRLVALRTHQCRPQVSLFCSPVRCRCIPAAHQHARNGAQTTHECMVCCEPICRTYSYPAMDGCIPGCLLARAIALFKKGIGWHATSLNLSESSMSVGFNLQCGPP